MTIKTIEEGITILHNYGSYCKSSVVHDFNDFGFNSMALRFDFNKGIGWDLAFLIQRELKLF